MNALTLPRWMAVAVLGLAAFLAPVSAQDTTAETLTREREQQTGTAITILFDNSGSMKGEKIKQAKSAFRAWLQSVPEDYKFSLITFEGDGKLDVPLGEHNRNEVLKRVASLSADTGTPICGALRLARDYIEKRRREVTPYERHVVLIFTDGQETSDVRGINGVREDISALRAVNIEVVGVGFHGEGDYMNGVATRFALAKNEEELKQGLAKVDAEIGSVDDLVVSAADLAALKEFHAPSALPTSVSIADSSSQIVKGPRHAKQWSVNWFISVLMVWMVLRMIFGQKKKIR